MARDSILSGALHKWRVTGAAIFGWPRLRRGGGAAIFGWPRLRRGGGAAITKNARRSRGDEAIFTDPTGARIKVTQAVVDHMIAHGRRIDGREQFFPLIPQLIRAPAEIWAGFDTAPDGRVRLRRRYVEMLDLGRGRTIGFVADADKGMWSGLTFFRGNARGLLALRQGLLIFRR